MQIEMLPRLSPRRGSPVKVGNVYSNQRFCYYRVVVAIVEREGSRPWNNVVSLHVNQMGNVVGSSNQPETYMKEHQDLVGRVDKMPSMKIKWLRKEE